MASSSPNVVIYAKGGSQVRGEIRITKYVTRVGDAFNGVFDDRVHASDNPFLSFMCVDADIFQSFILLALKIFLIEVEAGSHIMTVIFFEIFILPSSRRVILPKNEYQPCYKKQDRHTG